MIDFSNIYEEKIADLRRLHLVKDPVDCEITSVGMSNLIFCKIESQLRSWDLEFEKQRKTNSPQPFQDQRLGPRRFYSTEAALAGLDFVKQPAAFLVLGSQKKIEFYFGTSIENDITQDNQSNLSAQDVITRNFDFAKHSLSAVHRGIGFENKPYLSKDIIELIKPYANFVGVTTGIPALKLDNLDGADYHQMDRLCLGLRKSKFGILTLATPIPTQAVLDELENVLTLIEKTQMAEDYQKKFTVKQYLDLMEYYKNQIDLGVYIGLFHTTNYFFAQDMPSFVQLEAGLRVNYSDPAMCKPIPFRVVKSQAFKPHLLNLGMLSTVRDDKTPHLLQGYRYTIPLTARFLSAYIHLPKQELPGLGIRRTAVFATASLQPKNPNRSIAIGTILDKRQNTKMLYRVDIDALQKHTLVCGVTGGGKTNTCFYLLGQIWNYKIPFMVIEPAKSEYRHMMLMSQTFKGIGQAFSLGDETVSPFRLNPFEIMKGVKVQTHLDALKSVFNASFEMYAPMPQVLEKALNSIYTARGWDLIANKNRRLPPDMKPGDPDCPGEIYPTMKDLFEAIDPICESFGFSERIGPDVQAALKARIGSLLIGGKGQMLNTRRSIPPEILFGRPTVVELKMVSEDSEKSFLMGMLLVFLYEYREAMGPRDQLQHIMLVEEAHRLLKNVSTAQSGDSANPAGKAVEFFTNMLAEIRSYGQGFIIADQIPNKLAPETLKNTNLKIMHRIVAKDDRDSMGDAMNMDDSMKRHATALEQGEAIVYAEGMQLPYHLAIMFDKTKEVPPPKTPEESNDIVRNAMKALDVVGKFDKYYGCVNCVCRCDSYVNALAKEVSEDRSFRNRFNNFVLQILFIESMEIENIDPQTIFKIQEIATKYRLDFEEDILNTLRLKVKPPMMHKVLWCLITQASERYFERRGEFNFNRYDRWKMAYAMWIDIARGLMPPDGVEPTFDIQLFNDWRKQMFKIRARAAGPLVCCLYCTQPCQFGFEVEEFSRLPHEKNMFMKIFENSETKSYVGQKNSPAYKMAEYVLDLCDYYGLVDQNEQSSMKFQEYAYCLMVHLLKPVPLSYQAQKVIISQARGYLIENLTEKLTASIFDVFEEDSYQDSPIAEGMFRI